MTFNMMLFHVPRHRCIPTCDVVSTFMEYWDSFECLPSRTASMTDRFRSESNLRHCDKHCRLSKTLCLAENNKKLCGGGDRHSKQ